MTKSLRGAAELVPTSAGSHSGRRAPGRPAPFRGPCRWSSPRTLISNGARQSLFKSKPPYETSFLKKLYDRGFSLRNAMNLRQPGKENINPGCELFTARSDRSFRNLLRAGAGTTKHGAGARLGSAAAQTKAVRHLQATAHAGLSAPGAGKGGHSRG